MSGMQKVMRIGVLIAAAGLAGLAGCGTTPASQPGSATPSATATSSPHSPAPSSPSPTPTPSSTPSSAPRACTQAGNYLTSVRVGEHAGYDRVVFQFSGGMPGWDVARVAAVYQDPKGTPVALAGQSYLRVVFHGATAWCAQPPHLTYTGPSALTPFYPELLVVAGAGDFEGYLSFGIGLAAADGYHAYALTAPDRLVIDVSHVALGKFPGITDITSWRQYWDVQYAWNNGHQPWRASPILVVEAWARQWGTTSVVRQVDANTFKVTEPSGRIDTVTGIRPVTVPGPWVITSVVYGSSQA
jgi:hypothetical protein